VTRLTAEEVTTLADRLGEFEAGLREITGLGLRELAMRTVAHPPVCVPLYGARVAAVPVTSGEGVIRGFSDCVVAILRHLGCDAWVTAQPDLRGVQEAYDGAAEVVFLADDFRFVALNTGERRCVDNDPATADGYATALEAGDVSAGTFATIWLIMAGVAAAGAVLAGRIGRPTLPAAPG